MPLPTDPSLEPRSEDLPRTEVVAPAVREAGDTTFRAAHDGAGAPAPTDDLELLSKLGEGAQGRVFLARQRSLADRPVVIKVTSCDGGEHLSLARLQHTHIVPLYWVQDDPARDRRTLCMPYFGTVTLAKLLTELRGKPSEQRSGQDIIDVLDRAGTAARAELPARGPARQALAGATYSQALAWAGACLADALHYAHEHGLVHLDLKPSNVLLAADGQPMLLDFHLAREPVRPGGTPPRNLGGTPYWMSPEQRAALEALRDGRAPTAAVDGRSDIYSLGLILYQALGGPIPAAGGPRLDELNPQVSPGLADIIQRCLEPEPASRYADAGALAADLRRHLADQPLRGVPNRSWRERWEKWRRRRPQALLVSLLIGVLVAAAIAGGGYYRNLRQSEALERLARAARHLQDGLKLLNNHEPGRAVEQLDACLALARDVQGGEGIERQAEAALTVARRAREAAGLRKVVDRIRFAALAGCGRADQHALAQECLALWEGRGRLVGAGGGRARDDIDKQVRADLLDVAVIWAELAPRLAEGAGNRPARLAVQWRALKMLEEAEQMAGESAVLLHQRKELGEALQLEPLVKSAVARLKDLDPPTAWDHMAVGRRLLQTGKLKEAAEEFALAVPLDERGFWPHFYDGVCAYRREKYHEAVAAFRASAVAAAEAAPAAGAGALAARAYYNRGLAHTALNERERAVEAYALALKHDPDLAEAALNRGLLRYDLGQCKLAADDLRLALAKGVADPAAAHYGLALALKELKDRDGALASVRQALLARPQFREAQQLLRKLENSDR